MKIITVSLADIEGVPHGSASANTNVKVTARYTSPVVLADGRVIPQAVKGKQLANTGTVEFSVYASDDPAVAAESQGFAIRFEAQVANVRGEKGVTYTRTVKPLMATASPVSLGSLAAAEPVPAQWTTVAEVLGDFDSRLGALEGGAGGLDIKVGGSAPASGWWLDSGAPEYDPTAPSAPTGVAATATGSTTISLSWVASTDNIGVTGYEYRIGSGSAIDAGVGTSEIVSGLTASTLYSFSVRAYDAAENRSAWSTAASSTTLAGPDVTPPTPGTLSASAITTSTFTLTASGASDAGAGLHAQPYRFSTDNGATWSAWQAAAAFNVTGKTVSTAYTCSHQVRDAAPTPNLATGAATVVTTADPTPVLADDFNRADTSAGTLGTTTTGGKTWVDAASNWRILGNRAVSTIATPATPASLSAVAPTPDMRVDFTIVASIAPHNSRQLKVLALFNSATSDYYRITVTHGTALATINVAPVMGGVGTGTLTGGPTHSGYDFGRPLALDEVVDVSIVFKTEGATRRVIMKVNGVERLNHVETRLDRPEGTGLGLSNELSGPPALDNLTIYTA